MLTLLKDEKEINPSELNGIVERSRTEHDFDEAIKPYIKSSPADFKLRWSNHGFAATKVSVWEILLKSYFNSSVENTLQVLLKISHADIVNNVEATQKIFREVSQDLAGSRFTYGDDVHKSIQASVRTAFMNNKDKYRKEFRVFQSDPDVNPVTIGESAAPLIKVTDGMKALKNIPPFEVKALLSDLYETRYLYKFDTDTSTHVFYSMYESFLRVYFKHEMKKFNALHRGQVKVILSEHNENKYKKLDEIMEAVYSDFIISGIAMENVAEFQHAIFLMVEKVRANSTVPVFGQKELTDPDEEGNFGNGRTFASSGIAPVKFDKFIKGFIALSKLYGYLREAGFSPYHIHADIFSFGFEDPSNKFLTLDEVVEFSSTYVQARYKYNLTEPSTNFKSLQSASSPGSVLTRNYDNVIISNRNKIVLDNLAASVTNLTSAEADLCYATMHLVDTHQKINIFKLARSLANNANPLYMVFQEEEYELAEEDDPEEVWDMPAIRDYFSYVLKANAEGYEYRDMDRESFMQLAEHAQGDLSDLFDDIMDFDMDTQINILMAIEAFVLEFKGFLDSFNRKYTKGVVIVSEMEYSTFLFKHKLFADLHDIIDPGAYRNRDDDLVLKVILTLLRKHYPELTLEKLKGFFQRTPKNVSYGNFIDSVQSRTFKDITNYFHYAKANLFNLSDQGRPIKLGQEELLHAINNAPLHKNLEAFSVINDKVKPDKLGYLINDLGELYQIRSENNKFGALHNSGFYIFTDGTAIPWS